MDDLMKEAVVLLLQDLHDRKKGSNADFGKQMLCATRSLLDRMGAPYTPETARMPEAEQIPTKDEPTPEIGSNWLTEWTESAKAEVDDLIPERQGRDGLSLDASALIAERNLLADQLADAGSEISDLRLEVAELQEVADQLTDMENDRDKWQLRADYLEGEYDKLQDRFERLKAAYVRVTLEKNAEAVKRIEGVA